MSLAAAHRFPTLDAIWSASEQAVRSGLDPPALRLSPAWRLLLLAPTPLELALQLIARDQPHTKVIEAGQVIPRGQLSDVPDEVKVQLEGAILRTQHSLCDSTGRALAYVTTWSAESEFQSGEGAPSKSVSRILYGHSAKLEMLFLEAGPLWGRVIAGRSSVSYEVVSPHLATFIGSCAMPSTSVAVNHLHVERADRGEVALSAGDAHQLGTAL